MKLKTTALILIGLITGVVILSFHIYQLNKEKVCSLFQEHQLSHAQDVAHEIEEFFQDQFMTLQIFLSSRRYEDIKGLRRNVELFSETMKAKYIREVSLYDESGEIIYSKGSRSGLYKAQYDELSAWAKKDGKKEKVFISPLTADQTVIAVPVYQEMPENKSSLDRHSKRFVGIFSATVDLKKFLMEGSQFGKLQTHQTWIVKSDGTLFFYYQHPEMESRNLSKRDETCNRCHISHNYLEKILREKEGKIKYEVKEGSEKLAAFSSAQFGNASWTVVVDSDYDKITGITKKDFQAHLALLVLIFLAFLLGSFQIIRKERLRINAEAEAKGLQERITERQKTEEELKSSRDRLRFLSMQLLKSQETERSRIAGELHDELGQDLLVFKLLLDQIIKKFPEAQDELKELCVEARRNTDHLVENVHRIFQQLSPHILENFGLTAAIQRLTKDFVELYHLGITEDITNIDHLVSVEAHIVVYRIVQEILNNIGKHAQASEISIVVKRKMDHITLIVKDNGKGFNVNRTVLRTSDGKGIGLAILEERVRMLDGVLDIQSEIGKGTLISITIPVLMDNSPR